VTDRLVAGAKINVTEVEAIMEVDALIKIIVRDKEGGGEWSVVELSSASDNSALEAS
jgi:hypothetical protein